MMYRRKRDSYNRPLCDLCGTCPGTDMHELLSRGTTFTDEARYWSYQQELCAWLCRACHEHATSETAYTRLWGVLFALYGKTHVEVALSRLQNVLRAPLPIPGWPDA